MTAREQAEPPRDPIDGWPLDKPHPGGPSGPRAELDQPTGPLLAGTAAWGRWVRELSDCPDPPASDVLVEARRVARRVAALGRAGSR